MLTVRHQLFAVHYCGVIHTGLEKANSRILFDQIASLQAWETAQNQAGKKETANVRRFRAVILQTNQEPRYCPSQTCLPKSVDAFTGWKWMLRSDRDSKAGLGSLLGCYSKVGHRKWCSAKEHLWKWNNEKPTAITGAIMIIMLHIV